MSLVAYFESPAAALAGPAATIPVSAVFFTQPISDANAKGGRTNAMQVRINLSGWHHLPAGMYRGTLNLLAITE